MRTFGIYMIKGKKGRVEGIVIKREQKEKELRSIRKNEEEEQRRRKTKGEKT